MCGIAGICGPRADLAKVRGMADSMPHRGPDADGAWTSPRGAVALSHRRLSILDLSDAGLQPMHRGPLTIVYNGEIYNLPQLRQELLADGAELHSTTDTEVILELYRRKGAACLDDLFGMFAFAIWDEERRELFAARDRMGIKPFVYRVDGPNLAFASEAQALAGLEDWPSCTVDDTSVRDFFTYKYIPTPKTIYREIAKLPAGHSLTWSEADPTPRIHEYWKLESTDERRDLQEAAEEFDALAQDVIRAHALSDVPVGVFLSGGVDSSTVAAHTENPYTFNLGFDVRSHDETPYAAAIAAHLGARHETLRATSDDLEEALGRIAHIYDEPFGDHGAYPIFQISRLARRDAEHPVTVALTGEGGDELFGGYQWHWKLRRPRGGPWQRLLRALSRPNSAVFRSAERRLLGGVDQYAGFLGPFTVAQKRHVLSPDLMERDHDDLWAFRRHWREELPLGKRIQWVDTHVYLRDDMLHKVDRASMAVSLEARPPLVDHRVAEFAMSLHEDLLQRDGRGKLVLRAALESRVPERLLTPKKTGLTAPVKRWIANEPEVLRAAQMRLHARGILRRPFTRLATNEQTWCTLVLDQWFQRHAP